MVFLRIVTPFQKEIYINIDKISAIMEKAEGTAIYTAGDEEPFLASNTAREIIEMIEKGKKKEG